MIIKAIVILLASLFTLMLYACFVAGKRADEQHEKQRPMGSFSMKIYKNPFDLEEDFENERD